MREPQTCDWCRGRIPRSAPGNTSGTRGTKAYFENGLGRYLCLDCGREENRLRTYLDAEQTLRARAPRWQPGMDWEVLLDQRGRARWGSEKIVAAIAAGTLESLKVVWAEGS